MRAVNRPNVARALDGAYFREADNGTPVCQNTSHLVLWERTLNAPRANSNEGKQQLKTIPNKIRNKFLEKRRKLKKRMNYYSNIPR